jgi:hypothetical protein
MIGYDSCCVVIIRRYLAVHFLTDAFSCLKYCSTLLETVGQRLPIRNFTDFSLFSVDFKRRKSPSVRCALEADAFVSDIDIFNVSTASVNVVNWFLVLLLNNFINCLNV